MIEGEPPCDCLAHRLSAALAKLKERCQCVREVTDEHDVVVELCAVHTGDITDEMDARVQRPLDDELDQLVKAHALGRRVTRIWGDEAAGRR